MAAPLIAASAFIVESAHAQTWTTTTSGTTNWSTAGWNTAAPVSGTSTIVNFLTSGTTLPVGTITATNDLTPNPFVLNQLNIFGTGPATGGAALTLNGNGITFDGTNAQLNVNANFGGSGYTVTIANALTFNTATAINFSNGGAFVNLTGAWSGAGNVTFTGGLLNRALTRNNASTFTGDLTLATGTGLTVFNIGGQVNGVLGANAATTQAVIVNSTAGVNIDSGNGAYTQNQNFILNGNGNAATNNAALNITNINFGNGNLGGLAVNSDSTIRIVPNTAGQSRGYAVSRGLVGTGNLTKTGEGYLFINGVGGSVTWGGTAYNLFTGNITINEGVVQTPGNTNFSLGSGATQTVLVNNGAAFVFGSGNNACTNPQNFVLNGAGTGYAANGGGGIAAFSTPNAGFGSNAAGSLTIQTDSSVSVLRNSGGGNIGLRLERGLFGNGTLSLNSQYGENFGVMFVDNGAAATQATSAGTFNTFGGQVVVNNAALTLLATNALGSTSSNQVYLSGAGAFGSSIAAQMSQTFLSRISNAATSSGALALGVNSSNNLDFTSAPNLRLGASGGFTYSGLLTPGSNGYRLGGGGGTLTVSSNLTGSAALNVGATVNLTGAGNTFSGGITIAGSNTAADYVARLNFTGGTGILPSNNLTFAGIGGTFAYTGAAAGSTQSMGSLSFSEGLGTVLSTYGTSGNTALTFSSLSARSLGAVGNVNTSGGTNGTTHKISVTGLATGFVDRGLFFNSSNYAFNDSTGFLRAPVYGTDANFATSGTTATLAGGAGVNQQISGAITAQNTASFNTLRINGGSNFTLAAAQTVTVDGILKAGGTDATITGGTGIQASLGSEMVINNADNLIISTVVLNNGGSSLTKSGTGTLTLGSANTYTGTTTVAQGTLTVSGNGRLADTSNVVVAGGTYNVAVSDTVNAVTLKNGVIGGVGNTLTASSYDLQNGQVNAILAGAGGLVKNTEGLVLLTGANTYSGATTINGGSLLVIGRGARIPTASAVSLTASGASLDVAGITESTVTIGSLAGVTGSSVRIGSKSLSVGGSNSSTNFNGTLSGTGGNLTKVGNGVFTLGGTNSYTGNTLVSSGTLVVGNGTSGSLASGSAVTVASGATLAGNAGTIAGPTSISGGGRLAPGNGTAGSIGTQTLTGTLAFASTSIFDWDINSPLGADPGKDTTASNAGSYDRIINNNATKMSGSAVFNVILGSGKTFDDAFWNTDKKWDNVFSGTGVATNLSSVFSTFTYNGTQLVNGLVPGQGTFGFGATGTTLTWTAVPEPTSALAGLLIAAGLLRRRRSA